MHIKTTGPRTGPKTPLKVELFLGSPVYTVKPQQITIQQDSSALQSFSSMQANTITDKGRLSRPLTKFSISENGLSYEEIWNIKWSVPQKCCLSGRLENHNAK